GGDQRREWKGGRHALRKTRGLRFGSQIRRFEMRSGWLRLSLILCVVGSLMLGGCKNSPRYSVQRRDTLPVSPVAEKAALVKNERCDEHRVLATTRFVAGSIYSFHFAVCSDRSA